MELILPCETILLLYSLKMGVERLQLCIRFCNVCGLLPFRMVLDEQTKQFKRFDGHWRHPANWWFAFLSICYILFVTVFALFLWTELFAEENDSLTAVHKIALAMYFSNFLAMISVPRLFLLRFRHFERSIEILHHIDHLLDKMPQPSCHIRLFTIIGISVFLLVVGYTNLIVYIVIVTNLIDCRNSTIYSYLINSYFFQISGIEFLLMLALFPVFVSRIGIIFTSLHYVFIFLYALQLGTWLLLFLLMFYSLSHRFSILTSFMSAGNTQSQFDENLTKKFRICARIVDQMIQSSKEISSTFSFSVLMMLTFLIILCATSFFFVIYALSIPANQANLVSQGLYVFLGFAIGCISMVIIILVPAGFPITKVCRIRSKKSALVYSPTLFRYQMHQLREKLLEISGDDNLEIDALIEVANF